MIPISKDCPLGSLFFCLRAALGIKKSRRGAERRAAQAGGILESFLDYRSTERADL